MDSSIDSEGKTTSCLGARVKQLMKINCMKTKDLADKLGLSAITISKIIDGSRGASIDTLIKLAWALDTSVSYLVGEINYSGNLNNYTDNDVELDGYVYVKIGSNRFIKLKGDIVTRLN